MDVTVSESEACENDRDSYENWASGIWFTFKNSSIDYFEVRREEDTKGDEEIFHCGFKVYGRWVGFDSLWFSFLFFASPIK